MFQPFEASLWFAVFVATSVVFVLLWVFDGGKVRCGSRAALGV